MGLALLLEPMQQAIALSTQVSHLESAVARYFWMVSGSGKNISQIMPAGVKFPGGDDPKRRIIWWARLVPVAIEAIAASSILSDVGILSPQLTLGQLARNSVELFRGDVDF